MPYPSPTLLPSSSTLLEAGPAATGSIFADRLLELTPSFYWPGNRTHLLNDLSPNNRDGGGGYNVGAFEGSGPPIYGEIDRSCTWFRGGLFLQEGDGINSNPYAPITAGANFSACGWAYLSGYHTPIAGYQPRSLFGSNHYPNGAFLGVLPIDTTPGYEKRVRFAPYSGGSSNVDFSYEWEAQQWHFWGLVFDNTKDMVTLVVDGLSESKVITSDYRPSAADLVLFGVSISIAWYWYGAMGHMAFWDRAISPVHFGDLYDLAIYGTAAPRKPRFIHEAGHGQ